jgi:outer membrane protein
LEKCIDYALQNNIQVKQANVTSSIYSNDHLQSKLNFLPSVEGNINFNTNYGNSINPQTYTFTSGNAQQASASLQGTLPVFTGLQQIFNVERTKYELLASKMDYENAKRNIALSVASAYLQVLLNKEILTVAEKQKLLTETQKSTVASKIKAGALPETSAFEVDAQLARDEVNVVNAKSSIDLGLLQLRQLLQITDEKFDIETPEVKFDNVADVASLSSVSIYEYALANQPSIMSADARVKSANAARKISIGALSPTIAVYASLSSGYSSQDRKITGYETRIDSSLGIPIPYQSPLYGNKLFSEQLKDNFRKVVGVQMNIPLFNKWQRVTNIQNARLQMQIRELQLDGTKNQLRSDIEQAYTNAKAAVQSYLANDKSVQAADKSFQSLEKRFGAGMLGSYEFQQAKNNLAIAESEKIKSKYTYVFRLKVLDFYQGKPLKLEN